ncbi:hypothetical protein BKA70DRAFT_1571914 [Coprinopsis sp. MPI-PUGE-AT-0042]|nr:hypothetical protein BKA70DRAFT_1571914 [Coprinopsis sp. MPI-PUGE-AT-0042]
MPLLQYPYSHSTYFTRLEGQECSSELPPMNSAEDVAQIRFMHDRMLAAHESQVDTDITNVEGPQKQLPLQYAVQHTDHWQAPGVGIAAFVVHTGIFSTNTTDDTTQGGEEAKHDQHEVGRKFEE